ncbi:MAG TPA: dinitrogenase iron-molybdenum cofactor biosynthesis protein [Pelotomaculum sp.]|nr:dinitrogenase iron-molybdenum cofactor biosynthesis protein [Pelotomaculum sp.]
MGYRVAVASSDGKFVNDHFGRAAKFLIFEVEEDFFKFVDARDNIPPCSGWAHDDGLLAKSIDLIADCQGVLVSQIGPGASAALQARGVKPFVVPDFIDNALKWLMSAEKI